LKYSKTLITGCSLLLLNGCLDVEDNNNNADVVQALNAQTAAIESQQENENKVTFQALVIDALDFNPVSSALVTVKVGSETIVDGLVATDGKFEVSKVPANSDIEVIVSSPDDVFVQRAFFMNTGASGTGVAVKDFGALEVSEPQEVQISVLNNADNSPIDSLEFTAFSHVGSATSSILDYVHTSTYDEVNGVYTIVIPKHLVSSVNANVDIDKDGKADFIPELSSSLIDTLLHVLTEDATSTINVYVEEAIESVIVNTEYRISILGDSANSILGAEVIVETENGLIKSTYDVDTEQYVISSGFLGHIRLDIPAFSSDDVNYQSSSVSIGAFSNGNLSVFLSGADNNNGYVIPSNEVVEIAVRPRVIIDYSNLELVAKSETVNPDDSSFSAFYSQAVTVPEDSISLTSDYGFSIVKGNESTDDNVTPGTTTLTGGLEIPVTHTLSLNNTKLTITPDSPLTTPDFYRYQVGRLEVNETGEFITLNDDDLNFTVTAEDQVFDINDVKLDNNNYTTNGTAIITENTAGQATSNSNYNSSVYFYFPASIESLQNFTMRQISYVANNTEHSNIINITIVSEGNLWVNRYALVQTANNEYINRSNMSISVLHGTAQPDTQLAYRNYAYQYMPDKTSTSDNSVTYEYSYETKAGEISTGTIVIPVQ